jgi:hypothetical protein
MHAVLPLVLLIAGMLCWKGAVSRLSPEGSRRRTDALSAGGRPWYLDPGSYTPLALLFLLLMTACTVGAVIVAVTGWTR